MVIEQQDLENTPALQYQCLGQTSRLYETFIGTDEL